MKSDYIHHNGGPVYKSSQSYILRQILTSYKIIEVGLAFDYGSGTSIRTGANGCVEVQGMGLCSFNENMAPNGWDRQWHVLYNIGDMPSLNFVEI